LEEDEELEEGEDPTEREERDLEIESEESERRGGMFGVD
jgi:hypothetical protein